MRNANWQTAERGVVVYFQVAFYVRKWGTYQLRMRGR